MKYTFENIFSPGDQARISEHYGAAFLQKVLQDLKFYGVKWELEELQFLPYFSVNCIFTGYSRRYGDIVLKIGKPSPYIFSEYQTLVDYHGHRFCKLYNGDPANGVLLLENIQPGAQLRKEKSLDKRIDVLCSIYPGLHIEVPQYSNYPTYLGWVQRITAYMDTRQDSIELATYMKIAEQISLELSEQYTEKKLLHGDLHHDNILLGKGGQYRLIDPKGVIGDPIFELGRFILNEPYEEAPKPDEYVKGMIGKLYEQLNIPQDVLMKVFFIEAAMASCWHIESGASKEYSKLLEKVAFVKKLLDGFESNRGSKEDGK